MGESCYDHVECNNGLACRMSGYWPYDTQCLPMAEVGSMCLTDFDCKVKNFCWKIKKEDTVNTCFEKYVAPDQSQFFWDADTYPEMNRDSIWHHGQFCQSGLAYQKSGNKYVAECVTVNQYNVTPWFTYGDNVTATNASEDQVKNYDDTVKNFQNILECGEPDGIRKCIYSKNNKEIFRLNCECGLVEKKPPNNADGEPPANNEMIQRGFCPFSKIEKIQNYTKLLKQMWLRDNCHTYDRYLLAA